jgi:ubiquinone/menaquinone biosynthesis C-methylase UbiE
MLSKSEHGVRFSNAAGYDRHATWIARRLRARIVADVTAADLADGARVLDAGTGPGRLPIEIAAALPHLRVDGVDLSPQMIDYARRRPGAERVTFTGADVTDLPFPDATFDLIVSSLSQHHWAVPEQGVRELRRVLRPGGRLWIYDVRGALRRATAAARTVFDPDQVHREPGRLISRLTAQINPRG